MIDVSDGLIADLGHICTASGVRIEVRSGQLGAEPVVPVAALQAAARMLSADWMEWVLTGGEDHALAATFPPGVVLPEPWNVVGIVAQGSGVLVDDRAWSGAGGWEHFRSQP